MLRGLFEGAQYNSEAGATRAVNSRAQTKQGREEIKEITASVEILTSDSKSVPIHQLHFLTHL